MDWYLVDRLINSHGFQGLLTRGRPEQVELDLDGFDAFTADGLVLLLVLVEHLANECKHYVNLRLPQRREDLGELVQSGFVSHAARWCRLFGISEVAEWKPRVGVSFDETRILRVTIENFSSVQRGLDDLLSSRRTFDGLNLRRDSEDWFETMPKLIDAVHQLLKNVVQHSQTKVGYMSLGRFGHSRFRLTLGDCGVGLSRSLREQGYPTTEVSPVVDAALHRFKFREEPGIFTVLETLFDWGGEFLMRSGGDQLHLRAEGNIRDSVLVARNVRNSRLEKVAFLPGVQYRIDLTPRFGHD